MEKKPNDIKEKIKIYHKEKIDIDSTIWTIKFSNEKKKDEKDFLLYGRTFFKEQEIIIFVDTLNSWNVPIKNTLWHEVGHALWIGLPSHSDFSEGTNIMATGFEWAIKYYDKINKIYNNYKKKVNK